MQAFTANQAKTRSGEFLDLVQREPVQVMRHDRVVGVKVSALDFAAMRAFYANRLQPHLGANRRAGCRSWVDPRGTRCIAGR